MSKQLNNQYHPPVCDSLHIILEEDEKYLHFEEEHQLGTGSKAIDCLIIKKEPGVKIRKRIGQIFLGHNLIEIKGYGDVLSIDDYYKALGYCFFYKADTGKEDSIKIQDITLTFICPFMPRKLLAHLKKVWKIECVEKWKGIYYLEGFILPMQLIVASRLDGEENLWLRSILMPIDEIVAEKLTDGYEYSKDNNYYNKVYGFIWKKSKKLKEEAKMREAIHIIYSKEFEEQKKRITNEVTKAVTDEVTINMASKMLKRGLACDAVSEDTGLSLKEVKKLQAELLQTVK
ncbi:MAG: 3-isopropylmalate dehydrogenase [Lachnospiraceae bacterium]|nr:3-isopropylmalate dehydrogenase [Lachnospiraceae bacterium]